MKAERIYIHLICFTAQFYNVIYQIQRAVTDEIVSRNPRTLLLTPKQRQKELMHFIKVASRGGDIDFARVTFGKSLFAFMKVSCCCF